MPQLPQAEDDFFNEILPDFDDDEGLSNETTNEGEQQSDTTAGQQPAPSESQTVESGNTATGKTGEAQQPAQESASGTGKTGQQAQEDTKPVHHSQSTGLSYSSQGHIVDKEGRIVARAGAERRLYERSMTLNSQLETANKSLSEYKQAWESFAPVAKAVHESGLSQDELTKAIQFYHGFKTDPMNTGKALLAQLEQMGYNPMDGEGTLTLGAIANLIDQRLSQHNNAAKPFQDPASANQGDPMVEAQRTWNEFLGRYPDAALHEQELATILTKNPNLGLQDSYIRLYQWAQQNGFDWTKPLAPQYQARASANANNPQNNAANQSGQQQPRPMNPGTRANPAAVNLDNGPTLANADASYGDIIREEIRRSGMNTG